MDRKLKKNIAILGSTGSIGVQALQVIKRHPENFQVEVLTANGNADVLIKQALEFNPSVVVIADEKKYKEVAEVLQPHGIEVCSGTDAIAQVVTRNEIDIVLTALVGYSGLQPTFNAINAGKNIALANKETLVIAGELVTALAQEKGVQISPVDSEHSAIFQCIAGESANEIEKIFLTASGGPFRGKNKKFLTTVTKEQALKHPNWQMGAKITIDSASMMNKGLEVIEARWLFNLKPEQIEVIVHPQSIIHSIVQFKDGSMKTQMGLPDMRIPIQYALSYPHRLYADFPRFNFINYPELTFEKADIETFRNLALAYEAMQRGGNIPCIMNAANEIAIQHFLQDNIGFLEMSDIIEECMSKISFITNPTLEDYIITDKETRIEATQLINKKYRTINNLTNNF